MKRLQKPGARWLAGILALVMAFVFAAPPAGAAEAVAETAAEVQTPTSDNSLAQQPTLLAMADAKVREADPAEAMAVAPAQDNQMTADKPFLKSGKGIAAIALLVAGTIVVAHSRSSDRPTSPVR
jgi:hypothetical protein